MNARRIRRQNGFSLVESLATLVISGVLVGAGVPGFASLVANNRVATEVNSFVSHVHLARSEAIKWRAPAILCPSNDGQACFTEPQWHRGYILFIDQNGNRARDSEEPLIRLSQGAVDAPVAITSSQSRRLVRFFSDGTAGGSNLTVTFCDVGDNAEPRAVVISNVGRPRITSQSPSGDELSCS